MPWWFVTPRHAHEHRHFSAWFGQTILRRTYAEPARHDLYVLHDLLHAITFIDRPTDSEAQWRQRMCANEIAVSLETEVLIYARMPALRPDILPFPIWADELDLKPGPARFMDARRKAWWGERALLRPTTAQVAESALFAQRPKANEWPLHFPVTAAFADPDEIWAQRRAITLWPRATPVEQAIIEYESQADGFYRIWADHWRVVEQARLRFAALVQAGEWVQARQDREAEWDALSDDQGVPYGWIARRSISTSTRPMDSTQLRHSDPVA